MFGHLFVTGGKRQRHHAYTVFVALEVAAAVESLERVGGVILIGAQKRGEPEFHRVGALKKLLDKGKVVLLHHRRIVVVVLQQVIKLFFQIVEEHRVLIHVLEEILVRSLAVFVKLDLPIFIEQIQHCIERVVVKLLGGADWLCNSFPQLSHGVLPSLFQQQCPKILSSLERITRP